MGNESRRCSWVNPNDPMYVKYHDEEWSKPLHDERALYELFILETFQAGLSWATILHKRRSFGAHTRDSSPNGLLPLMQQKLKS